MHNNIKIYADGSNLRTILELYKSGSVDGFTTNPSLVAKEGIKDYLGFIKSCTDVIKDLPISFEVITDDLSDMERQARVISECGKNIYVKIPITNTLRESTGPLIRRLLSDGIRVNVTAILAEAQVDDIVSDLRSSTPAIVSVFAGRIADTGVDPMPVVREIKRMVSHNVEVLWASCREVFNITQAELANCDIITVTPDILGKLPLHGKNLLDYSCETVKGFYNDALKSGIKL